MQIFGQFQTLCRNLPDTPAAPEVAHANLTQGGGAYKISTITLRFASVGNLAVLSPHDTPGAFAELLLVKHNSM